MIRPVITTSATEEGKRAKVILCALRATLTDDEIFELVRAIQNTNVATTMAVIESIPRPNACALTAVMMTRFADEAGMSEISDAIGICAGAIDSNTTMSPAVAKVSKAWYIEMFPDWAEGWFDKAEDFFSSLTLPSDKQFDKAPVFNLFSTPQGARFLALATVAIEHPVQVYQDFGERGK